MLSQVLENQTQIIIPLLKGLSKQMTDAATALSDIQAGVAANTSAEQSAATLLGQLAAAIQTANGVSPDAVEALAQQLQAQAATLAAAVTANTPTPPQAPAQAPAPTPTPTPTPGS